MRRRLTLVSILALLLFSMVAARAAPPPEVQIEVDFLLGYIDGSGCEFYRNGTWYDAKSAQVHLRKKYNFLAAWDRIQTTEDFIEKIASKSSFNGIAYEVRCYGHATVTSSQWLREELARYRAFH